MPVCLLQSRRIPVGSLQNVIPVGVICCNIHQPKYHERSYSLLHPFLPNTFLSKNLDVSSNAYFWASHWWCLEKNPNYLKKQASCCSVVACHGMAVHATKCCVTWFSPHRGPASWLLRSSYTIYFIYGFVGEVRSHYLKKFWKHGLIFRANPYVIWYKGSELSDQCCDHVGWFSSRAAEYILKSENCVYLLTLFNYSIQKLPLGLLGRANSGWGFAEIQSRPCIWADKLS